MTGNNRLLLSVAIMVAGSSLGAIAQTYYGNGYTIVEGMDGGALPDDLDARVFKTINAHSVEEGLRQLLEGSGWSLAGYHSADPAIWRLYNQPYPDNKRTISPMALGDALTWIAGNGWELVVDPVNRLISFEVKARYAPPPILPVVPKATAPHMASNRTAPAEITPASGKTAEPASEALHTETYPGTVANPEADAQTAEFIRKIEAQTSKKTVSGPSPGHAPATPTATPVPPPVTAKTATPTPVPTPIPATTQKAEPAGSGYTFADFGKNPQTAKKRSTRRNK